MGTAAERIAGKILEANEAAVFSVGAALLDRPRGLSPDELRAVADRSGALRSMTCTRRSMP